MADSPLPVARLQAGTDAPGRKGRREKQTQPLTPDAKKAVGPQSGGFFAPTGICRASTEQIGSCTVFRSRVGIYCGHIC